ncbi:MAG: ionic transporter y4hA [Sphingobacteriales bacterium]|nr:MAG: ionic transporter y4hA [Sphingobacteriales bacterium]
MQKWKESIPVWTIAAPVAAVVMFFLSNVFSGTVMDVLLTISLVISVLAGVHHAEVVAHKVGEPYGTLILAFAITTIEVSLIVSLMLAGGEETHALARDTVFAAVMIIITGIIGICLVSGGVRHHEQSFGKYGVYAAMVTLTAICVLTLVLPNYTTTVAGPKYNNSQLIFVGIISLILYGTFVLVQTQRHREYFLPAAGTEDEVHIEVPSRNVTLTSLILLIVSLGMVVMLAKKLSPTIEGVLRDIGAPQSLLGVIIAFVILLPEGLAALKAARKDRLQTSLNLALGSALASIGLTIPAVAIVSIYAELPVTLGIDAKSTLLLVLSLFSVSLSFNTGRTTIMQGVVLLVLFAVYIFTIIVP